MAELSGSANRDCDEAADSSIAASMMSGGTLDRIQMVSSQCNTILEKTPRTPSIDHILA